MTLDKALEVVAEDGRESGEGTWEEYLAAIKLGREALKQIQRRRTNPGVWNMGKLQGETED